MCTGFPLPLSFWHFIVRLKDFPQPMERGSHMHRSLYGKAYRGALLLSFIFFSSGEEAIVSSQVPEDDGYCAGNADYSKSVYVRAC